MARKKSSALAAAAAAAQGSDDLKSQSKRPRDLSPDHKMDNLKTLNQLLLKEAMEKRLQIDQLKSQIEDLTESQPLASDIEREVCVIVLDSAVAEVARKVTSLQEKLGVLAKEKDEMWEELRGVVSERDLIKKEAVLKKDEILGLEVRIRDLEVENGDIRERLGRAVAERDEMERLWRKKEEAFDSLKELMEGVEREGDEMSRKHEDEVRSMRAEIEANLVKIRALEEEVRGLLESNRRLEGEFRASKDQHSLLKGEVEGLRSKVVELEGCNGEAQEEIRGLRESILALEKEKGDVQTEFDSKVGELEAELGEVRKKMGEMSREKDDVEEVRARCVVEILELKNEAERLRSCVVELEAMCGDYGMKNAGLVDENDAVKRELATMEKEVVEKKVLEAKVDELSAKAREISMEKDEVEHVKAKQDGEIVELKKELENLRSNVSELEERCRDYSKGRARLQEEREAVEKKLGIEREESCRLRLQVDEMKKSKDGRVADLKKQIASLTDAKSSLEKTLIVMKEETEETAKKMRAAEMVSDRALSLLKSTAEAMHDNEKARENGVVQDGELSPFSEELESIKYAFMNRTAKIEEMNRELENMQKAVEDAKKKKKPGLLMWLYPATTTVLAAISVLYAARGGR